MGRDEGVDPGRQAVAMEGPEVVELGLKAAAFLKAEIAAGQGGATVVQRQMKVVGPGKRKVVNPWASYVQRLARRDVAGGAVWDGAVPPVDRLRSAVGRPWWDEAFSFSGDQVMALVLLLGERDGDGVEVGRVMARMAANRAACWRLFRTLRVSPPVAGWADDVFTALEGQDVVKFSEMVGVTLEHSSVNGSASEGSDEEDEFVF